MSVLAVLFLFTLAFIVSVDLRITTVVGADHYPSAAYASIRVGVPRSDGPPVKAGW